VIDTAVRLKPAGGAAEVSDRFDHLEESEREWLRASRRSAARRSWLLIGALVLVAIFLAWLTVNGLPGVGGRPTTTTTITPEQQAMAGGERALADWGRFAVTKDLGMVKNSFWPNGPQYRQLVREARREKPLGPPPYQLTMSGVQVLTQRPDQRVLRGLVEVSRPGEQQQRYRWDVVMRRDPRSGDWRLWTVRPTAGA
jgi:hypothetical protein